MRLDQFMKWCGWVSTGGEAKIHVQGGGVRVNGTIELRRGRRLIQGDEISFGANKASFDEIDS